MIAPRGKAPTSLNIREIHSADEASGAACIRPPARPPKDSYGQVLFALRTYPITLTGIGVAFTPLAEKVIAGLYRHRRMAWGGLGLAGGSSSVGEFQ